MVALCYEQRVARQRGKVERREKARRIGLDWIGYDFDWIGLDWIFWSE